MAEPAIAASWTTGEEEADDLIRTSKAARVRVLIGDGLSLSEIARRTGLSEAEVRELMDVGRAA
ncbi:hypothetical protein [Rhizobium sp. RU36D]|uniref:hypothetical protein n=1 Tax=Rhizobium sp. RU36D TaxID=1907415 RepID=UPI0009D83040|nr:hypothetical protein [Rhizobium sp. RU36D]SMD18224.1 hypothetical protein SAMN05880593_13442 [Rhizobium sp. RU36D]